MNEKQVKEIEKELYTFLLEDEDFKQVWIANGSMLTDYHIALKELLSYVFYSEFNPYLDKPYVDYAWIEIQGYIINLDDIYDCFKNMMNEVDTNG